MRTAAGADVVAVAGSSVADTFRLTTGSGGDAIGIQTCFLAHGRTTINTGSGVDGAYLGGGYQQRLTVNMGSDNDVLALLPQVVAAPVRFVLGGGDDVAYVHSDTLIGGNCVMVGGGGTDDLAIHPLAVFAPTLRSFESSVVAASVDAQLDVIGGAFVTLFSLRGGDPGDLVC